MTLFAWLAKNPLSGQVRNDIRADLRSLSHGNYVVYFRPHEDILEIVRLLHGARDIQGLF